jgi:hypothetical protein
MKQLWSILFSDFCSFFSPSRADNSCINRTDMIVKLFLLLFVSYYSQSVSDWPYPCGIYIYISMLSETRTSIQGGEERRMISSSVSSKANVDHHTYTQQTFLRLLLFFLLIARQKIIVSENKFDYLIASILVNTIAREWHLTDVYNTNKVLFDILLNVNRCRRCFHKFLSNMTLVISFFFV